MISIAWAWVTGAIPWLTGVVPWTLLALLAYIANIVVGTASLRAHRMDRRWHSRLFVLTCVLTVLAAAFSFPAHWGRGLWLLGALIPLAALPFFGAQAAKRPVRHVLIAAAAAPCYFIALVLWAVSL